MIFQNSKSPKYVKTFSNLKPLWLFLPKTSKTMDNFKCMLISGLMPCLNSTQEVLSYKNEWMNEWMMSLFIL